MYGRPNNNNNETVIQRNESGEEGEIGEEDGEVAAVRTPQRGRGRGGMRGRGMRGRGGRGRWGSPRSNSFRGFRNEGNMEGIHRSQSLGGEQQQTTPNFWNNNSFRGGRRDSFRNPEFSNNEFRPGFDASFPRGGPPPPPPPNDGPPFLRNPMNQRGGGPPPMEQRGGGPPMEQRGGGPPMEQRGGGPPMDQREGGPLMDQRGGGPHIDQRGGGPPMDQRGGGLPMDQRGGGPPFDQRSGGPPFDQRSGGPPFDQRGFPPMDQRGMPPLDQRGNGPPMEQRGGGGPMDQRGLQPMEQRGGQLPPHQMDQRGGPMDHRGDHHGNMDQRGPLMDQQGGIDQLGPMDQRGLQSMDQRGPPSMDVRGPQLPPVDPRGGNNRGKLHQQPIAPPPPPPHLLVNPGNDFDRQQPPPGNFSPFPEGSLRNEAPVHNSSFRNRNDFREFPSEDNNAPFQFGRNRDSFGGENRHFPRRDEHPPNRRMTEPFHRDGGMMGPRGGLFPEGPISGTNETFQQAPGMRGTDQFGRDGTWNPNERPQEPFQRQINPRDGFQQQLQAEESFPSLQRTRDNAPFNNPEAFSWPSGGQFQQQAHGQQFQREDSAGQQFQGGQEAPFTKPAEFRNIDSSPKHGPMDQGFREGRGGRRNDFNRRRSTERSYRDIEQQLGQSATKLNPLKAKEPESIIEAPQQQLPIDSPAKHVESKQEPQPLSCLEERDLARGRAIVLKIGDMLGLPLSEDHLPQKKDILKAMAMIDSQIKTAGSDADKRKNAMVLALAYEREQAISVRQEAIAQATEQATLRLKEEESKEQAELDDFESTLSGYVQMEKEKFQEKQAKKLNLVELELAKSTKEEEKKQREALNEQMIQTADDFDQRISELREHLDRATSLAKKHSARLSTVKERAKTNKPLMMEQKEGNSLMSRIIAENRAKAAKSHMLSLGSTPDCLEESSELETLKDPKCNRTASEWSALTRQVTGLSNALYCEPSEAPYFESNEKKHIEMAPYITEFIKQQKEKLTEHWTGLANEYEERRRVFNKKMGKRSRKSSSSIPARQLPVTQIGGGSSSTVSRPNPYRRARREVRSDYEQEQLIEELKLAEAMEKRIQFGGCTVPRQVGKLEKQLTPQFRNTFRAQRIDVMELEQSLLNTSVWSDMEKCIFLDRWLQFPKDFRKIATFLRNKTTKDCIRFYYDSKQAVPYKAALREHHLRRKRRGITWEGTFEAAVSVGAVVKAGINERKPLVFLLPDSENTFRTRNFHPMKREVFDSLVMDNPNATVSKSEESDDERPAKKRCLHRPLFTPSEEQSKFLQTQPETAEVKTDDEFVQEEAVPIARRSRQKWSVDEKSVFIEILGKQPSNGRPDWKMFSEALPSKSLEQIKNFYYDYKKPAGRNRGERKRSRRQDEVSTPTPLSQNDSVPPTPSVEPRNMQTGSISGDGQEQHGTLSLHALQQPHYHHQQHHRSHPYGDLYGGERSGTSTPDPMELAWTQQLLMSQGGEAARRLLQSHQQQQHHQLLSSLMPWSQSLPGDWNEQHQHQQLLLRLQQQQTNQQLAALGLGGYRQDDAQLALAQHLLNLQNGNGNYRNGGHGSNHGSRGPH